MIEVTSYAFSDFARNFSKFADQNLFKFEIFGLENVLKFQKALIMKIKFMLKIVPLLSHSENINLVCHQNE